MGRLQEKEACLEIRNGRARRTCRNRHLFSYSRLRPPRLTATRGACVNKSFSSVLIGLALCVEAHAATFVVTNTNSGGAGSLRQAITDGVAATVGNAAHDTVITFNIPGAGVHPIRPPSPLPPIKDLL